MGGLFGEAYDITLEPKPAVKNLIKKINTDSPEKNNLDKVLKSKAISLQDRLALINERVLSILGKQKNNIIVIKDKNTLHQYISDCISTGRIDIDTETNNSLDPVTCQLMGPCFYAPGLKQAYVPINHVNPDTNIRLSWQLTELDIKAELQRVIEAKTKIIMHNGKFDYEVLKCTCKIEVKPDWDTIIAARLIDENEFSEKRTSLKYIYTKYIDPSQTKYDIEALFENIPYAVVDPDIFALYAATDAMMTDKVYMLQKPILDAPENKKIKWVFENIEMPIVVVTAEMELTGVAVDTDFGDKLKVKYARQLQELDNKIDKQMEALKVLVQFWKTLPSANQKTRVYQPKKTKLSEEKIEARYPFYDDELGKRYKIGKCKAEQIKEEISLSSPVQLAILFYDVLQCPPVSKKAPRGTGEEELKALSERLKQPNKIISDALTNIFEDITALRNNCSNMVQPKEEVLEVTDKFENINLFSISDDTVLEEDILETDEYEDESESSDIAAIPQLTIDVNSEMSDTDVKILMEDVKKLYTIGMQAAQILCKTILERRGIVKLVSTYIDVIPDLAKHWPDGRIRFHLNSLGTDTGRYSSGGKLKFIENNKPVVVSGINIQNIPSHNKEIRMLFKAKEDLGSVVVNENCYTLPEISEIETSSGWKFGKDLKIGDHIISDEGQDTIINIIHDNTVYYLYIEEGIKA